MMELQVPQEQILREDLKMEASLVSFLLHHLQDSALIIELFQTLIYGKGLE